MNGDERRKSAEVASRNDRLAGAENLTIVVDSNQIVERDWRMVKHWWSGLLALASTGAVRLVVPEIVILEVLGRYRNSMTSPARELGKLGVSIDVEGLTVEYEAHLRTRLNAVNAVLVKDAPVTVTELARRAVERRRPFNDQGNGFRDAALWMYVLDEARRGADVVFLSSDGGFTVGNGADRRLHPALEAEAGEAGSVTWYPDIDALLKVLDRDGGQMLVQAEISQLLTDERAQVEVSLRSAIEQAATMVYGHEDIRVIIRSVGDPIDVHGVSVVQDAQDSQHFIVSIDVEVPLVVDVDEAEDDVAEILKGVELEAVRLSVDATYDKTSRELSDFSGDLVELYWDELAEGLRRWRSSHSPARRAARRLNRSDMGMPWLDPEQADLIRRWVESDQLMHKLYKVTADLDVENAIKIRRLLQRIEAKQQEVGRAVVGTDDTRTTADQPTSGEIHSALQSLADRGDDLADERASTSSDPEPVDVAGAD